MPIVNKECDPKIQKRQKIERRVVSQAVNDLLRAGYFITVDYDNDDEPMNSEDSTNECKLSRSYREIMEACGACDEETLACFLPSKIYHGQWRHIGSVSLVYGNDGWDVISDYHTALDKDLANANALADKLGE